MNGRRRKQARRGQKHGAKPNDLRERGRSGPVTTSWKCRYCGATAATIDAMLQHSTSCAEASKHRTEIDRELRQQDER